MVENVYSRQAVLKAIKEGDYARAKNLLTSEMAVIARDGSNIDADSRRRELGAVAYEAFRNTPIDQWVARTDYSIISERAGYVPFRARMGKIRDAVSNFFSD